MVYIKVEDATDKVCGVFTHAPDVMADCTVYFENYDGSTNWSNPEIDVFRDGFENYRTVDNSGE